MNKWERTQAAREVTKMLKDGLGPEEGLEIKCTSKKMAFDCELYLRRWLADNSIAYQVTHYESLHIIRIVGSND